MIRRLVAGFAATAAVLAGLMTVAPAPTAQAAVNWRVGDCQSLEIRNAKICLDYGPSGQIRGRLVNNSGRDISGAGTFFPRNSGDPVIRCSFATTESKTTSYCKRGPVNGRYRLGYRYFKSSTAGYDTKFTSYVRV